MNRNLRLVITVAFSLLFLVACDWGNTTTTTTTMTSSQTTASTTSTSLSGTTVTTSSDGTTSTTSSGGTTTSATTTATTTTTTTSTTAAVFSTPINLRVVGDLLMWDQVPGASQGYALKINGTEVHAATNLVDLKDAAVASLLIVGLNSIQVRVKATAEKAASPFSAVFEYVYQVVPQLVTITAPQTAFLQTTIQLSAVVDPSLANQTIVWSSSDESIAEISAGGLLTAKAIGEVLITATSTVSTVFAQVIVEVVYANPTAVDITGAASIELGGTLSLSASVTPMNAFQGIVWSVDDISIATVSSSGFVTSRQYGIVYVTAAAIDDETIKSTVAIEIIAPKAQSISISGTNSIVPGQSLQLQAIVVPANASSDVEWTVDRNDLASISSSGLFHAIANGTVVVTASAKDGSGKTATLSITIADIPMTRLVVYSGMSQIRNNETALFVAFGSPSNASQEVLWSVSDPSKASISEQGLLTPVAGMTGDIFVTAASKTTPSVQATFAVRIIDSTTVTAIVTTYAELVAALNGTATHIVLANDIDATGQSFVPTRTGFQGVFDGAGHVILNLAINPTSSNAGLFKQIGGYAVIKDVIFVNPKVTSNFSNTALIAGQINQNGSVTISNVVAINMIAQINASQWTHGGFIAHVTANSQVTIVDSYIEYTYVSAANNGNVGGFVGVVNDNSNATVNVFNSYVDMKVNAPANGQIFAAIIGQVNIGTKSNVAFVMASLQNIGTQNALVNGGLVYSQLNSAGTLHFIQDIVAAPSSQKTLAFINNNGNTQLNGATANTALVITSQINPVLGWVGERFGSRSSLWTYDADNNVLSFVLPLDRIQAMYDTQTANAVQAQIAIPGAQTVIADLSLPVLIDGVAITWSSSHPAIVSNLGAVVRPQGQNAVVTMTYTFAVGSIQRQGTIDVTVVKEYDPADEITMSITGPTTVATGNSIQLGVSVEPNSVNPAVVWSIKNAVEGVVSISSTGLVTGLTAGEVVIVATLVEFPTVVAETTITVTLLPTIQAVILGDGFVLNDPANAKITLTANVAGTLYYIQSASAQTAEQVLASGSKRSVQVVAGTQTVELTITSANKVYFVLAVLDGATVVSNSTALELSFAVQYQTVSVGTYAELVAALNNTNNVNIALTANIVASGTFTPTRTAAFIATFNGNGYSITGLSLVSNGNEIGMFKLLGGGAVIKNVTFVSPRISSGHINSGLLGGRVSSGGAILIENIVVTDLITTITSSQWTHGGLIGTINTASATVTIRNVMVDYTFQTASSSISSGNVGGLVGTQFNTSTVTIQNAWVDMKVNFANTNNSGQIIGAFIGQVNASTTTNVAYSVGGIRNIGPGSPLLNAGIVYSQMNNAGANHTVTSVLLMTGSAVTQITNQISTINGATSKTASQITSQFFTTINATIGNAFVAYNAQVWVYSEQDNVLTINLPQ